jgi:hypothetical protein
MDRPYAPTDAFGFLPVFIAAFGPLFFQACAGARKIRLFIKELGGKGAGVDATAAAAREIA